MRRARRRRPGCSGRRTRRGRRRVAGRRGGRRRGRRPDAGGVVEVVRVVVAGGGRAQAGGEVAEPGPYRDAGPQRQYRRLGLRGAFRRRATSPATAFQVRSIAARIRRSRLRSPSALSSPARSTASAANAAHSASSDGPRRSGSGGWFRAMGTGRVVVAFCSAKVSSSRVRRRVHSASGRPGAGRRASRRRLPRRARGGDPRCGRVAVPGGAGRRPRARWLRPTARCGAGRRARDPAWCPLPVGAGSSRRAGRCDVRRGGGFLTAGTCPAHGATPVGASRSVRVAGSWARRLRVGASGCGFWPRCLRVGASGCGFWARRLRVGASGCGFWARCLRLRTPRRRSRARHPRPPHSASPVPSSASPPPHRAAPPPHRAAPPPHRAVLPPHRAGLPPHRAAFSAPRCATSAPRCPFSAPRVSRSATSRTWCPAIAGRQLPGAGPMADAHSAGMAAAPGSRRPGRRPPLPWCRRRGPC